MIRSLFFFLSFLFLPPLHCNNSPRLCGAKRRCSIRRQHFQLVLPEGETGGTEWLKNAPFCPLKIHKALFPKCCLLLYLVLSCYTYRSTTLANIRTGTLDFLIQCKHSVLVKPRVTSDRHTSAFIPNAVLVGNYFYPMTTLSHVRRDAQPARRCLD